MEVVNQVRGYHFLLGVFRSQQADPYCSRCSAFANTLTSAREGFAQLASGNDAAFTALDAELAGMTAAIREGFRELRLPPEPSGQKKAGRCRLPQGVCFLKASYALVQQI